MTYCKKPDRHVPGIECGYPIPCPHHTVIADPENQTVTVPLGDGAAVQLPAERAGRVGQITKALRPRKRL